MDYSFYETAFIFIIYSFIGWCAEVVFAAATDGKFVNRGFNTGPVCPIYGIGVLLVVLFLEGIKNYWGLLFIASVIFTSVLEFAVGFLLEKLFHEKWWDYTDEPFNIKGYICLRFSLLWGLACVLVINVVHPTVMKFVDFIPKNLGIAMLIIFYAAFAVDFSITLINVFKIRKNLRAITEIENALESFSESIGTNLSDGTLAIMEYGERLKEALNEKEAEAQKRKESMSEKLKDFEDIKTSLAEKRTELEELSEKLKSHISAIEKPSKHLRSAFPNIGKGKYKDIFKSKK